MSIKARKAKGFILIEILICLVLLSAGILFLVRSLSVITRSNMQIRNNRLAYLLLENIYNQLYSGEQISPGKVILDENEYQWDFSIDNTHGKLKRITVKITWGKGSSEFSASLSHLIIGNMQ